MGPRDLAKVEGSGLTIPSLGDSKAEAEMTRQEVPQP
jgi:hypothetical protein